MRYIEKNNEILNAIQLANKGQHDHAKAQLCKLSNLEPNSSFIIINIANICFVLQQIEEVERFLDQFMLINEHEYSEFYFIATELYASVACFKKSIKCAEKLTEYFPENADSWAMLAQSCYAARATDQAISAAKNTIKINGDNYEIKVFLAYLYSGKGLFEEAEVLYQQVLSMQPGHSIACAGIAKCRKFTEDSGQVIDTFEQALKCKQTPENEARIRFSLAKIYNDIEDYDKAWMQAEQANQLNAKVIPFDREQYSRYIDRMIDVFSTVDYQQLSSDSEDRPILVLGMPRSGTTLTEQILSLDPNVYPGGEKQGIDYALLMGFGNGDHLTQLKTANKSQIEEMARRYFSYFSEFSNFKGKRIIDKVPANYLHFGLFRLMYKNVKVINMQRNPLDVATSIFFENFSFKLNYTNNIYDILLVYKEYQRLMAFWEEQFPENILNVEYQSLTENYEHHKQKIITFCELKIPENGDHSAATNAVETPSLWQVRQGIYQSSVERWKRYEKYLSKYQDILF